jgi:hypothetical protein
MNKFYALKKELIGTDTFEMADEIISAHLKLDGVVGYEIRLEDGIFTPVIFLYDDGLMTAQEREEEGYTRVLRTFGFCFEDSVRAIEYCDSYEQFEDAKSVFERLQYKPGYLGGNVSELGEAYLLTVVFEENAEQIFDLDMPLFWEHGTYDWEGNFTADEIDLCSSLEGF